MKLRTFAIRNAKEILRDPLTIIFSLGFPVVLLILLSAIQANIPVPLFVIENLAPGIAIFGLAFMSLFSATLISRDRETALLQRLYTTPLTARDFILGYALPMIPISVAQSIITYLLAVILGMPVSMSILYALLFIIPVSLLYIALGLMCGSVFNVKQVGGICGALLTNLSAWLSGIWFDLELVGGLFRDIAYALPFVHAVELQRSVIAGNYGAILPHLAVVLAYSVVLLMLAIWLFVRQMKKQ